MTRHHHGKRTRMKREWVRQNRLSFWDSEIASKGAGSNAYDTRLCDAIQYVLCKVGCDESGGGEGGEKNAKCGLRQCGWVIEDEGIQRAT